MTKRFDNSVLRCFSAAVLVSMFCVANCQAAAHVKFRGPRVYPTRYPKPVTMYLTTGDFNNDGRPDVVAVDTLAPSLIAVFLCSADGTLTRKSAYRLLDSIVAAVGDFDGDGNSDLAVAHGNSSMAVVTILAGNGDGTFRTTASYPVPRPSAIIAGDFNRDGHMDVATAAAGHVAVLTGNGDGTFQDAVLYPAGPQPVSLTAADFNGDGRLDLAVANNEIAAPSLSVLFGNPDGTFQTPVNIPVSASPTFVIAGDLNADGHPDLAAVTGSNISVLLNTGTGSFQPPITYAAESLASITIADFDGDGKVDLATAGLVAGNQYSVLILAGNGDGTFGPPAVYATGEDRYFSMGAADFNGDGKPDLVLALEFAGVLVLMNNSTEGFVHAPSLPVPGDREPIVIAAGDFDGDGRADVVVTPSNSDNGLEVLLSSTGRWSRVPVISPFQVAVADLNGDGLLDLAVTSGLNRTSTVYILLGNGDGTFQPAVGYTAGSTSEGIAAGDFNGDGKLDLAVPNEFSNDISILIGNGDGTFQPQTRVVSEDHPHRIAVGDFNRDGKLDLVVGGDNLSILTGHGDGTFSTTQQNVGGAVWGFAVADYNLDGKLDVALTSDAGYMLLLGSGDGTFQAPLNLGIAPFQSSTITAADFNHDGIPDLAIVPWAAGTNVEFLIGKGDGTFREPVFYWMALEVGTFSLAAADFNGDGLVDLGVVLFSGQVSPGGVAFLINVTP